MALALPITFSISLILAVESFLTDLNFFSNNSAVFNPMPLISVSSVLRVPLSLLFLWCVIPNL